MKTLSVIIIFLTFWSCSSVNSKNPADTVTISGKIQNMGVGVVVLEYFNGNTITAVDTLTVNADGTYYSNYQPVEPGYYRLNYYQTQFVNILFTGDPIVVNVDGSNPTSFFEVLNSKEMDHLKELNAIIEEFGKNETEIQQNFREASNAGDNKKMEELRDQYLDMQSEKNKIIKEKIRNMGSSMALFPAVNYLDKDKDFTFIDSVAQVIDREIPDYKIKREFISEIEKLRRLDVGAPAPEIALPDPDGNLVKLSSLKGSYVLIDFWAAWCRPCRMENPNNVRLYEKYRSKGFEIYGVSLDRTKDDWLKAIKDDGLTWIQVSDLKYFQSEAASEYNINAIPATILLDKEGRIIAKNLRGKALEDKLDEIF